MKNVFLVLMALTFSAPAFARSENLYCKGMEHFQGGVFFMKPLQGEAIEDGNKYPYLLEIRDPFKQVIFSGVVQVEVEDVMFGFSGKAGRKNLSGMVYMDEPDQSVITIGSQKMRFDCSLE